MLNSLIHTTPSPAVWTMLVVLGFAVWIMFRPGDDRPRKLLLLLIGIVAFGPVSEAIMAFETAHTPLKFDYYLYLVDRSLGISAFIVARLFTEWQRLGLLLLYQSLCVVMTLWYAIRLFEKRKTANALLVAYLAAYLVGPFLYLIVPARGPRHAFGSVFPAGNPDVSPVLIPLSGWPNAMPSLHLTTALIFVLFAGENRFFRYFSWIYLAGTVAATLAFEHYLIDLVVAVPFACFAIHLGERNFRAALGGFALVLAWLLAIRFATPTLITHPIELRILALITVGLPLVRPIRVPFLRGTFGQSLPGFDAPSSDTATGTAD